MKIETLNEWVEENYIYNLLSDMKVISYVQRVTFSKDTRNKAQAIKLRLLNSNRSNDHKTEVKKYYYIKHYLNNFLCERPDNFDRLLRLMNEKDVITVENLRELNI